MFRRHEHPRSTTNLFPSPPLVATPINQTTTPLLVVSSSFSTAAAIVPSFWKSLGFPNVNFFRLYTRHLREIIFEIERKKMRSGRRRRRRKGEKKLALSSSWRNAAAFSQIYNESDTFEGWFRILFSLLPHSKTSSYSTPLILFSQSLFTCWIQETRYLRV